MFKETERKAVQGHLDLLGERVWSHTIVLFTHGDSLLDTSIEQHIESEGQDLQWLLDKCGNRYHCLSNALMYLLLYDLLLICSLLSLLQ
uniref:AIG1-type G domain-containing protein n=1 Tax=Sinocyclocheilus rhinocerous TaxID=307959 RepID=A0A673MQF3_9TELE